MLSLIKIIFTSLTPGGILSVTEVIADPHFQRRDKVRSLAESVGFFEREFFGNRMSFTINFKKALMELAYGFEYVSTDYI